MDIAIHHGGLIRTIYPGTKRRKHPARDNEKLLKYVRENLSQELHCPAVFLHGNSKTDHIILKDDGLLSITNLREAGCK